MIPNIFVSSTIEDLYHLRDGVRDTLLELGYNPIMCEYGDIGYLPYVSAEEACYQNLKDCQIAVIIIGRRYGSLSANGYSVTHNEYITARNNRKPVIMLVEKEVLAYKKVFDVNVDSSNNLQFPGMDQPQKTFEFISDFINSSVNNGFLDFSNATGARVHLKKQLAHIFGELLNNKFDSVKIDIQDVLSEVKTLRHELLKNQKASYDPLLKSFKYILSDENEDFRSFLEYIYESYEDAIQVLIEADSLDEFIKKSNLNIEILDEQEFLKNSRPNDIDVGKYVISAIPDYYTPFFSKNSRLIYGINKPNVYLNQTAYEFFSYKFDEYNQYIN